MSRMRYRHILIAATFAFSLSAQPLFERGNVIIHSAWEGCACEPMVSRADVVVLDSDGGHRYFLSGSESYRYPYPALVFGLWVTEPNRILASTYASVVVSPDLHDVMAQYLSDVSQQKLSYMGDILPMRSGDFLSMEALSDNPFSLRLVKFAASGQVLDVMEVPSNVPQLLMDYTRAELLADQCTVAWKGRGHTGRVHAFNICTKQVVPDLVVLPAAVRRMGSIRQLPNGDLLIATSDDVRRYSKSGKEVAVYRVPALLLALTPDASGFWATSASFPYEVYRVDFATPETIAYRKPLNTVRATALAVAGEWRASLQPAPPSRRRSAGH